MTDKKKLELISGYVQKCYHESYYDMSNAIADIANILESETINPVPSIPIVGGGSVASDRTEPGESGQSAEDVESIFYKLCDIARRDGASIEYLTKPNAIEAMRLHASQVCADKDARIKELEGLLSSDSVYGLFRFAYKSHESAQVYEISKKLRELKTK